MYTLEEIKEYFKEDLFATKVLGIEIIEANNGYAKCELNVKKDLKNARDVIMGGALYTLADFTFAVATNQNEGYNTVTTSSTINYLRPAISNKLVAEAIKIRDGKTICFYEINVYDDKNVLVSKINTLGTHINK